jgi:hypothetical protein
MKNEFRAIISPLVSKQLVGNANDIGEAIEALTNSLGLAIAVSCGGDISKADNMIAGVEGHLAKCITDHLPLSKLLTREREEQ